MILVPVAGKDGHLVAKILKTYSSIDDKSFSATNAKIRMEEDDVLQGGWR